MKQFVWNLMLWILASPIYAVQWLFRFAKRWHFWQLAYTPRILCGNCGSVISLVGLWRCHCGYTYRGHLLRTCPMCYSLPRLARCFACGVTENLPRL